MIILKASGNGGPILLSLSECLVGSVVWVALELVPTLRKGWCSAVEFEKDSPSIWIGPSWALMCQEDGCVGKLPNRELTSTYLKGWPTRFWARHITAGFAPMALVGLKPSFFDISVRDRRTYRSAWV